MRYWNIPKIKREITIYTIIAAAACEVISLPIFGLGILFPYGLAIGVCVAIVNLSVISSSIDKAVERGRKGPVVAGLIIRILLYGGAFLLAVRTANISGLGAAVGFLLPRIMMHIRYALLPWLRIKTGREPAAVYVTDTRSNVFIKEPRLVRYNKGRAFVTHRHYKKIRIAAGPQDAGAGDERHSGGPDK